MRPCARRSASVFCMSLRTSALHPQKRLCLLHVIANQCAHWCGNPFSPQGNLASWQFLGRIRNALRIRLKYCTPPCPTARRTDCHVAPLLAMTCSNLLRAGACNYAMTCNNLPRVRIIPGHCRKASLHPQPRPRPLRTLRAPRPCTRRSATAFCMSLRTSAHTGVAIRSPRRETWQAGNS